MFSPPDDSHSHRDVNSARFSSVSEWLRWQERLHPLAVDLGLERVQRVAEALALGPRLPLIITVAGTNGKGSCVAMLAAILEAAGYRVGAYTSPHLMRYNERIRLLGQEVTDDALCAAFHRIDLARGDSTLSYFEFGTLAALELFAGAILDVLVLEVGLGGRLDAVNVVDCDAALVSSIGIDHVEQLGADRESIGREKAGIFRSGRPAICADPHPPLSVLEEATRLGSPLVRLGHEYGYSAEHGQWHWWSRDQRWDALPVPRLTGAAQLNNAAAVLAVLDALAPRLCVTRRHIETGLRGVELEGRYQVLRGDVTRVFDVAHNPQAAQVLAQNLRSDTVEGRTHAVIGMLRDKDIRGVLCAMAAEIDTWHVGTLHHGRGATAATLAGHLTEAGIDGVVRQYATVQDAYGGALSSAKGGDRLVVFGSFITVSEIMALESSRPTAVANAAG